MRRTTALFMFLLAGIAFGQPDANAPKFVAADIHPSGKDEVSNGPMAPGSRINIRRATMVELISMAYGVKAEYVVAGAKWVSVDQFDVLAKAPKSSTLPELEAMLQALLADRFQLKVRREDRAQPVYALTIARRGLQLKPSASEGTGDCIHKPDDPPGYRTCTGVSIARLAEVLPTFARNYFDAPVVDRTGDKGKYDFTLHWSGRAMLGAPDSVSLYDVLEKLGIKVDKEVQPTPVMVIESANETPAPNPPDTSTLMPPMPTEFEVAVIKVNKRPDTPHDFRLANGRVDVVGVPLKPIIAFANNIDDDMVVGPPWLDSDMFDLTAKTDPTVDVEGMRPMLQKLVAESFHLEAHREQRPVTVYAITTLKNAKLTEGDPSARGGCKLTVSNGMRNYACENASMAELAAKVQDVAAGYLDHPVVDLTGLKGVYNFVISWSPIARTRPAMVRTPDAAAAPAGAASDPGMGITFFQGAEKMGLKFTQQKLPMPVLVIDKIERTPVDN